MKHSEFTRPALISAAAAAVGMSAGPTPMVSAVASLFMKPLAAQFDLSRTAISAILLISPLAVALCSPLGGRLLDRFGVRRVLLPAVLLFAAANAAMLLVQQLYQFVLLALVISACIAVHCYSSYTKVLALWFRRHRGVVTGVAIAGGSGLGAVIIPHLVQPWIDHHGWRVAYAGIGVIVLCWAFPVLLLCLHEPQLRPLDPGSSVAPRTGVTAARAVRMRSFWWIAAALYLAPLAVVGTIAHLFAMLTERGLSSAVAVNALSMIYVGGMTGQLSAGYLLDRIQSPRIVLPYFAAALVGIATLHLSLQPWALLPGAFMLGLGQGSEMSILAYLTTRYFGLAHYGSIYGRLYAFANFGIATGMLSMGMARDHFGTYRPMALVMMLAMSLVVILLSRLPPYQFDRMTPEPD